MLGCLLTLRQVKTLVVILLTLKESKKFLLNLNRFSCFLDGCFSDSCFLDGCFPDGCFWPLRLCKTPLGETGCLGNPYFLLTGCLSIQFFDSPLTQSVRPPMVTYTLLCSSCVTCGTWCFAIGHQVLPTQPLPTIIFLIFWDSLIF